MIVCFSSLIGNDFIVFNIFTAPCPTAILASLEMKAEMFVVVRYLVPDVCMKLKLIEFKSLQVNCYNT